jgi:NADPH:quinone reductase-like Zn-dependent oxidoreductase
MMHGIVFDRRELFRVEELPKPTPKPGQVLVQVRASSVNAADYLFLVPAIRRGATTRGDAVREAALGSLLGPVVGSDVAGVVAEVGLGVGALRPGDAVFGTPGLRGAWADYACIDQGQVAAKPTSITFEQAATAPVAGTTGLAAIRASRVKAGHRVLVYGASGGIGLWAVQLLKALGADVTAVVSTRNVELARTVGADRVIDYRTQDFARESDGYDAIIGVNGHNPLATYKRLLRPGGSYAAVGGTRQGFAALAAGAARSIGSGKKLRGATYFTEISRQSMNRLAEAITAHGIVPHIERARPMADAAAVAKELVATHPQSKTVLTISDGGLD